MAKLLNFPRPAERDAGFAIVMSVMLGAVVFMLGATWLAYATHESSLSSYDRRRQQAVDAANAGVAAADAALSRNGAHAGIAATSFPGGSAQYQVTVTPDPAAPSFRRVITAVGYAPSKTATDSVARTIRQVVELDPLAFQYAMFSESSIAAGSSSTVIGDVYAAGNVAFGNSQNYIGNVYARGSISTGSNQTFTGNLYADGNIALGSSSTSVFGSAYAGGSVSLANQNTVRDTVQAGGTISNCSASPRCIPGTPPPPLAAQLLPKFVWNPANYPAGVTPGQPPSKVNTQGTFYVDNDVIYSKNDTLWLTGNTTIVATGDITLPGNIENRSPGGATLQLSVVSTGSGTIAPSNNFTIPSTVRTLIYTKGVFDAKNSSTFTGSLYAHSLSSGAHIAVTYAPLDDTGFDWTNANPQSFTIRNVSTREIVNGT